MRELVLKGELDTTAMWQAFGLNLLFIAGGYATFRLFLRSTRIHGSLLSIGE